MSSDNNIFHAMEFDISRLFATKDLQVKKYLDATHEWDYVLERAKYVPVGYTRSMMIYQEIYLKEFVEEYINLSVVLFHNGTSVGVWPLAIKRIENNWVMGSNEGSVVEPIFVIELPLAVKKKIQTKCHEVLTDFCLLYNLQHWQGIYNVFGEGINEWHRRNMEKGATIRTFHDLYVDLSLDINEIKSNIRKSYRSLINLGYRLWAVQVCTSISDEEFDEYRLLHYQVAGRITRSLDSWDSQKQAINNGQAFLVTIKDTNNILVGGGLFHVSKDEGLYGVGVYNRQLFDMPLGHVVQMSAIEHMKAIGLKWYKIGMRHYIGDAITPTEKELKISYFKEGFATHSFLRLITECPIDISNKE